MKRARTSRPAEVARDGRLTYADDRRPGIRRSPCGRGFVYRGPSGRRIVGPGILARIRSLAVPPAWTAVWINPDPRGHVQATGRDARGRKQSRYHPAWRAVRDEVKFGRMLAFGRALPRIRAKVRRDLAGTGPPTRTRVVAALVRLLEETLVRVGNDEYARENRSYGLTTLKDGHVRSAGAGRELSLRFVGKGGKPHDVTVDDPVVARIVVRCQNLPGERLFQYVDADGRRRAVGSSDVNEYLREASGLDLTAKDFRTWAGTLLALRHLRRVPPARRGSKRALLAALDEVAARLRNTRAVCRSSYVHPAVLSAYEDGTLARRLARSARAGGCPRGLRRDEVLAFRFLCQVEPLRARRRRRRAA